MRLLSHNFQHFLHSQLTNQISKLLAMNKLPITSASTGINVHSNASHIISIRACGKKLQQPSSSLFVKRTGIEIFRTMLYMQVKINLQDSPLFLTCILQGIFIGTLTTGSVSDVIGRQRTLFFGTIVVTILFFLHLIVSDVIGLSVIRFCLGILYLLLYG